MKIIGNTRAGYLVEASNDEWIALQKLFGDNPYAMPEKDIDLIEKANLFQELSEVIRGVEWVREKLVDYVNAQFNAVGRP